MLKILGRLTSINVRKVLWTCAELDLAYDHEAWGAGFRDTQVPEFLALNPNAKVPVLIEDGFVLWESNTVCRYLANRQGGSSLLPSDPQGRARVEQWMDWQATELNTAWRYPFLSLIRKSPAHQDPKTLTESVTTCNQLMAILDAQLTATGACVAGDSFTLADVAVGMATHRWFAMPMERPDLPAVTAYYERLSSRPGFLLHGRNGMP
jgi:glutathione S-transferase